MSTLLILLTLLYALLLATLDNKYYIYLFGLNDHLAVGFCVGEHFPFGRAAVEGGLRYAGQSRVLGRWLLASLTEEASRGVVKQLVHQPQTRPHLKHRQSIELYIL